jgi:hypothetical protein
MVMRPAGQSDQSGLLATFLSRRGRGKGIFWGKQLEL